MALLNRVSQLFRADINAVLDQIEEPEQILRQAIRDMEDELARCENRVAACSHEQETLAEQRQDIVAAVTELDTELDLCFESGKEDLARGIIRRKLQAGRHIRSLDTQIQANERYLARERRLLGENTETLEALRQRAELFVTGPATDGAAPDHPCSGPNGAAITEEEIEIAFLREKSARGES